MKLIFVGIKFHESREVWLICKKKIALAKIISKLPIREIQEI